MPSIRLEAQLPNPAMATLMRFGVLGQVIVYSIRRCLIVQFCCAYCKRRAGQTVLVWYNNSYTYFLSRPIRSLAAGATLTVDGGTYVYTFPHAVARPDSPATGAWAITLAHYCDCVGRRGRGDRGHLPDRWPVL